MKATGKAHPVGDGTAAHPWAFVLLAECEKRGIDLLSALRK